jgi:DNA mismatch repair protein MutS2
MAPTPLAAEVVAEALETIEFDRVLAHVAGFAAGEQGAARVRARRPTDDVAWIRDELARVGEVAALFRRGDLLLAEDVPDLARPLARLRVGGSVLEPRELAALRRGLAAARLVEADLRRVLPTAPSLAPLHVPPPDKRLERALEQAIDEDGNVLDSASPALASARREVQAARARLVKRLEGILRGLDAVSATGGAVTVRGGRYVIPVRRDSRSRPAGIIHDESASQGTLFIEPSEVVELGNALREAETAEERETLRVLRELTELLRPAYPTVRDAIEMALAVDDLVARGRYAAAVDAEVPAAAPAPAALRIVRGRHPLLLAQGETVVPFDLELDEGERTLLVTGPNTGGKTVLLKATALACMLAQSGIVPPVGPGSRLPVFRQLFADIGDRQSIAASLSTFSAHVAALRRILDLADDATLVLLDEVGSGTDPAEGAGLAAATLVSLTRRRTVTLATTHLGALKDLATHESAIVNGSLQFDAATLTPTYRFQKGVPGRSYGLAIARRLGVPPHVLEEAERRVPDAEKSLDALLAAVEERSQALARAEAEAAGRASELESLQARLARQHEEQEARHAELARREKDAERRAREQAKRFLLDARQQVEQALGLAKQAADQAAAKEARRLVEEGVRGAKSELERLEEPSAGKGGRDGTVAVGDRVRVRGMKGDVLDVRPDGRLSVAVGAMRLVVDAKEVERLGGPQPKAKEKARETTGAGDAFHAREATFELDLRGMTGDEAEAATLAAVDAAVLAEQPYLRIIHGKGTGALRERVRRLVASDRRVARFDFAPATQGGVGVTVVEFGG